MIETTRERYDLSGRSVTERLKEQEALASVRLEELKGILRDTVIVEKLEQLRHLPSDINSAQLYFNGQLLLFKRHKNPDGTQGAFVEKTPGNSAVVKETVHAGENVIITGTAYIADKAVIEDDVTISGNVGIFNNVRLRGRIDVINNVHIAGMTSLVGINGNILMAKDYGLLKEGTVLGRHLRIVDNVIVAGNYPIRNEETD